MRYTFKRSEFYYAFNLFLTLSGKFNEWFVFSQTYQHWTKNKVEDFFREKLRIFSVNVTRSTVSFGLVIFTEKILNGSFIFCVMHIFVENMYFRKTYCRKMVNISKSMAHKQKWCHILTQNNRQYYSTMLH